MGTGAFDVFESIRLSGFIYWVYLCIAAGIGAGLAYVFMDRHVVCVDKECRGCVKPPDRPKRNIKKRQMCTLECCVSPVEHRRGRNKYIGVTEAPPASPASPVSTEPQALPKSLDTGLIWLIQRNDRLAPPNTDPVCPEEAVERLDR